MSLVPGSPCPFCAVRPDVACPHRPAEAWQGVTARPATKPLNKAASNLNGLRSFVNARTGQVTRVLGRGD